MSRYRGPKDPKNARPCVMRIDLSEGDKRMLLELASDRGVPMAGWIRMAVRDSHRELLARRAKEAGRG